MSARCHRIWACCLVAAVVLQWPAIYFPLCDRQTQSSETDSVFITLSDGAAGPNVLPARQEPTSKLERLSREAVGGTLACMPDAPRARFLFDPIHPDPARPDFDCSTCASLCRFLV